MLLKKIFIVILFFMISVFCGDKHYRGIVDIYFDIAKGSIPGHSYINKFGHNPAVATTGEDVWSGGGTYAFYPDTAKFMKLVCDSSSDSIGGTGALTVLVYGLDSNFAEINETVTTTGTAAVLLVNKYIRMYRALVLTAGSSRINAGDIAIQDTASGIVGAFIAADDGQTQQAIYTVPAGKTAYLIKEYMAMKDDTFQGSEAAFKWKTRANNGINGAWQTKGHIGLVNIGSSWWQYLYGIPAGPFLEKTDIKVECYEASTTVGATGGFDLILVDD